MTFTVDYNVDGTWTVTPRGQARLFGEPRLSAIAKARGTDTFESDAPAANADIKNESGTAVICTGVAANFNAPVTVTNLSNPGVIHLHSEYQVGPTGGPYAGRMCINKAGNTATFE